MSTDSQADYCMQLTWNGLLMLWSHATCLLKLWSHATQLELVLVIVMQINVDDHLFKSLVFNLVPESLYLASVLFGFSSCEDSHLVIKSSWLLKTISVLIVQQLLSCVDSIYNTPLSYMPLNYDSVLETYSRTVGILKSGVPLVLLIISSSSLRAWPKFGDFFYVDTQCLWKLQIQSLANLLIPSITLVQCYIIFGNNFASNESLLVLFPPIVFALKWQSSSIIPFKIE